MCDRVVPAKPGDKTFDELKNIVHDHIRPKPSEIVQRFKFITRLRQDHEPVSTYVSQLRHLSQDCNFRETLNLMLATDWSVGSTTVVFKGGCWLKKT